MVEQLRLVHRGQMRVIALAGFQRKVIDGVHPAVHPQLREDGPGELSDATTSESERGGDRLGVHPLSDELENAFLDLGQLGIECIRRCIPSRLPPGKVIAPRRSLESRLAPAVSGGRMSRRRACLCGVVECKRHQRKVWKGGERYQRSYDGASQELRRRLLAKWKANPDAVRCHLCGLPVREGDPWEVDHIIPASRGGASTLDNLALAHASCNRRRGSRLGSERSAERRRKRPP
jgi:5-methylcytosine-specific restriction endonuclease McrA